MSCTRFKPGEIVWPAFRATVVRLLDSPGFYEIASTVGVRMNVHESEIRNNDGIVPTGMPLSIGAPVHIANVIDPGGKPGRVVGRFSRAQLPGRGTVRFSCTMLLVRIRCEDGTETDYLAPEAHCIATRSAA